MINNFKVKILLVSARHYNRKPLPITILVNTIKLSSLFFNRLDPKYTGTPLNPESIDLTYYLRRPQLPLHMVLLVLMTFPSFIIII